MADTYEAFYNGKPLNPNRGLPTMTYAQAEDCGLTESERLWCRTDGEDTPITADDIPYDSNNSVKDKIDEVDGKIKTKQVTDTTNANGTISLNLSNAYCLSARVVGVNSNRTVILFTYGAYWFASVKDPVDMSPIGGVQVTVDVMYILNENL